MNKATFISSWLKEKVAPIATATAIAESEWKRELEKVSVLFELWRKQHPHDTELDCFIVEDRAFVRDRPDTCGTCIGQLERLERLMNNHSKSQRKQKRTL